MSWATDARKFRALKSFFCIWAKEKTEIRGPSQKGFLQYSGPMNFFLCGSQKKKEKNKKMQIHGSSVAACSTFCGKLWCLKTRILSAAALMQPFTASGDELLLSLQLLQSVS